MLTEIIRRYQCYNPETGAFDAYRSQSEYAGLLGLNHVHLSQMYGGTRSPGMETFRKLMRAFPGASESIGAAIASALVAPARELEEEQVPA